MRLGATLVHLSAVPPFAIVTWAQRLVAAGFESLWVPQLVGRGTLVPDPFVTLAAAAVATGGTPDVEVGTATVQVPLYHPADLAHRILSLQQVCGDRLTLGLSPGSTATDFAALDRDYAARFSTFRASVARLRVLLADGLDERVDLAPAAVIGPRPPLLLGSWGANVEWAAREFDGWLASAHRRTPAEIISALRRFRGAGGRRAIVCGVRCGGSDDRRATGELLHRYADAGFDDVVVLLEPGGVGPDEVRALYP